MLGLNHSRIFGPNVGFTSELISARRSALVRAWLSHDKLEIWNTALQHPYELQIWHRLWKFRPVSQENSRSASWCQILNPERFHNQHSVPALTTNPMHREEGQKIPYTNTAQQIMKANVHRELSPGVLERHGIFNFPRRRCSTDAQWQTCILSDISLIIMMIPSSLYTWCNNSLSLWN